MCLQRKLPEIKYDSKHHQFVIVREIWNADELVAQRRRGRRVSEQHSWRSSVGGHRIQRGAGTHITPRATSQEVKVGSLGSFGVLEVVRAAPPVDEQRNKELA